MDRKQGRARKRVNNKGGQGGTRERESSNGGGSDGATGLVRPIARCESKPRTEVSTDTGERVNNGETNRPTGGERKMEREVGEREWVDHVRYRRKTRLTYTCTAVGA